MITIKTIDDYVSRIGLELNLSLEAVDTYGDYIKVIDPDTDFQKVKSFILNKPLFSKKIENNGIDYVELFDTLWIDGNRTSVAIKFGYCDGGFGTCIKLMVKSVDIMVGTELKNFLSYDAYHTYVDAMGL